VFHILAILGSGLHEVDKSWLTSTENGWTERILRQELGTPMLTSTSDNADAKKYL
jgi:hypothetical protein